jgi:hypothetical protein
VKKHSHDDPLATSALLDQDAEAFAKKMFKHAQSRAQERWIDMEKNRKEKSHLLPDGCPAGTSLTEFSPGQQRFPPTITRSDPIMQKPCINNKGGSALSRPLSSNLHPSLEGVGRTNRVRLGLKSDS